MNPFEPLLDAARTVLASADAVFAEYETELDAYAKCPRCRAGDCGPRWHEDAYRGLRRAEQSVRGRRGVGDLSAGASRLLAVGLPTAPKDYPGGEKGWQYDVGQSLGELAGQARKLWRSLRFLKVPEKLKGNGSQV